jgi:hypothetical protein
MTTPAELLKALDWAGVTLSREGEKLKFKARPGALTADLKAEVMAHKPALLEILGRCPDCGWILDRGRCWACHYRLCEGCRRHKTGSAFIAMCLSCDLGKGARHNPNEWVFPT